MDAQTTTAIPKYLANNDYNINLKVLLTVKLLLLLTKLELLIQESARNRLDSDVININEIRELLNPRDLNMDTSQFDAFAHAMRTDLTIIQGPPGTGKTYIGLEIVKCLFANEQLWNPRGEHRPMLIVCYTNHALDQFLEGIVKFVGSGIVRVGGRCANSDLEQ